MKSKIISLILALTLALTALPCLAEAQDTEPSKADKFLDNLGKTWGSFLDMADDAGQAVSDWADESGVKEWAQGAVNDISDWANESGLMDWMQGAKADLADLMKKAGTGLTDWAQDTAVKLQTFIDEYGPEMEAWLKDASEEVRQAWNTLVDSRQHSKEEIESALETVSEALEQPRQ